MGTCAEAGFKKGETKNRFYNSHWQKKWQRGRIAAPGISKIQMTHYLLDAKLKT